MSERTLKRNSVKREAKYASAIELLTFGKTPAEVAVLMRARGVKISEQTCRRLRREYIIGNDRYGTDEI